MERKLQVWDKCFGIHSVDAACKGVRFHGSKFAQSSSRELRADVEELFLFDDGNIFYYLTTTCNDNRYFFFDMYLALTSSTSSSTTSMLNAKC